MPSIDSEDAGELRQAIFRSAIAKNHDGVDLKTDEADELRKAIFHSRKAMENRGGIDLQAIVAETAYDYWPHRAAFTRARRRVAKGVEGRPAFKAIGAEERAELVTAIHRTQEGLRGGGIDLETIAREGSRHYWSQRRAADPVRVRQVNAAAIADMALILRRAAREFAPRRERRRLWSSILFDAVAVLIPWLLIPPLLISISQGRVLRPSAMLSLLTFRASFADRNFAIAAFAVLCFGAFLLWVALRKPETRRRISQFGGAATASLLVAVLGTAYVDTNKTSAGLDRLQASLTSRLLLALERSDVAGYLIVPTQADRSIEVETKTLSASMAMLYARTPGTKGEIRVRLEPQSANYWWYVDGREIPKGRLAIGRVAAFENDSITIISGNRTSTFRSALPGLRLPVGSRVAAEIGTDDRIASVIVLPPQPVRLVSQPVTVRPKG